jgi:hypothetical protein
MTICARLSYISRRTNRSHNSLRRPQFVDGSRSGCGNSAVDDGEIQQRTSDNLIIQQITKYSQIEK